MDRVPAVVNVELCVRLLAADGAALPMDARLTFSAEDPYAVEALFDTGAEAPVRWVFARELLAEGLSSRAGIGDVVVEPVRAALGERQVLLRLSSPDGSALLEADAGDLERFLAASYAAVPAGTEADHLDIGGALGRLLARG